MSGAQAMANNQGQRKGIPELACSAIAKLPCVSRRVERDRRRSHERRNRFTLGVAKQSLTAMLGATDLKEKSFLDAGCGSGLFGLAARLLGASVHPFDYDPNSVRCAQELRRRYFPKDPKW